MASNSPLSASSCQTTDMPVGRLTSATGAVLLWCHMSRTKALQSHLLAIIETSTPCRQQQVDAAAAVASAAAAADIYQYIFCIIFFFFFYTKSTGTTVVPCVHININCRFLLDVNPTVQYTVYNRYFHRSNLPADRLCRASSLAEHRSGTSAT